MIFHSTDTATMATLSIVDSVDAVLKTMTAAELDKVIERASAHRGLRFRRFLDLPAELRNRIYSLAIQPQDVEIHARMGKAPSLFKVNKQIATKFEGLYYNEEVMRLVYYDNEREVLAEEQDTELLKLILSRRAKCDVDSRLDLRRGSLKNRLIPRKPSTDRVQLNVRKGETYRFKTARRSGVLTWHGFSKGTEANCSYPVNAVEAERSRQGWKACFEHEADST